MSSKSPDKLNEVDRILVEPIFKPISENFLCIRRNLLVVCLFGLLYKWDVFNISDLSISGIKIKKDSIETIEIIGFSIILYQFIHFTIEAWEHCIYWRIRVTGIKLAHVTAGKLSSEVGDYPDDPQQSTLYNWWLEQKRKLVK